ncbi:hypothetical protein GCM10010231_24830 [Streptomyces sindenensis]|nr:hypothetical protein GCM10010231_24830 [Streptomyces sindenensis]
MGVGVTLQDTGTGDFEYVHAPTLPWPRVVRTSRGAVSGGWQHRSYDGCDAIHGLPAGRDRLKPAP